LFYLLTLFSLLLFDKTVYSTFHPELVQVVDRTDHLLMRGNIPRDKEGHFCFEALLGAIKKEGNLTSPFDLTIISLLTLEREDEALFIKEINNHPPSYGRWMWWQVRAHLPKRTTDTTLITHQTFEGRALAFPSLIHFIYDLMHTPNDLQRVIYFHCRHGCNRSSAVAAGYLMRCGLSFEEAWEKGVAAYFIYEPHELENFLRLYQDSIYK
jgi:hypothetical protein